MRCNVANRSVVNNPHLRPRDLIIKLYSYEGFGIENNGGLYQWYYTDRGERKTLNYFSSEKEIVQFALKEIKADEHSNRNLIGIFRSKEEVQKIISELNKRNVEYWTDKVPYGGINVWSTRIFAIGCGIKKVQDLIRNYKV